MARYERLLPWLDALQSHAELSPQPRPVVVDAALATGVIWLRWTQVPAPGSKPTLAFCRAFEALKLLALLARIDYDDWLSIVARLWPKSVAFWVNAFYPARFKLGIAVDADHDGMLRMWGEHAWPVDSRLTSEYRSMRDELETALRGRAKKRVNSFTEVGVKASIDTGSLLANQGDLFSRLLSETLQLAKIQAARRPDAASLRCWRPHFRLLLVELVFSGVTWKDMLCMEEISSCGVQVPSPAFRSTNATEDPSAQENIACLQRLIVAPVKNTSVPIASVEVDIRASRQTMDSVFSSVFYSKSVPEIAVYNDIEDHDHQDDRERLMYWLALCVFGRYGSSPLHALRLDTSEFQMSDIQTLERALQDDDAFVRLFPEAAKTLEDECVVATASEFVLTRPQGGVESPEPTTVSFRPALDRLQTIAVDDDWASVLLPGYGQAWVSRFDVSLEWLPGGDLFAKSPPIQHLSLEMCNNETVVLELLRLVGIGLELLEIDWTDDGGTFSEDGLLAVFCACPVLTDIDFTGVGVESLDLLARCYAEGTCNATRLVIHAVDSSQPATDPSTFFKCLADAEHRISQHLQELTLKIRTPRLSDQLLQLLSTAVEMLQFNRYLWNLDITIIFDSEDNRLAAHDTIATFEGLFADLDGESVAVRVAPLHIKTKLAFLSVLHCSHQSRLLALTGIDASVASLIFEYAAECKKRHAQVFAE